jgi:predicted N-acetyltransferase YhbS
MTIRRSLETDRAAISRIHVSAFGEQEGPVIAGLVNGLLDDSTARPLLSLVAEEDGQLVGHVLFTAVGVEPGASDVSAQILAPLGVSKARQRSGVGEALVREGLRQLTDAGFHLVFVLGHPGYYPRFGFRPAGALGLEAPYPIAPENAGAWMVAELQSGVLGTVRGTISCAAALDEAQYWVE